MKASPYSNHYNKIRAWMKKRREESGLSIRDVGEIQNRHHSVIGKMEQDRRKLEIFEFVSYCQAIGANPHEALDLIVECLDSEKPKK